MVILSESEVDFVIIDQLSYSFTTSSIKIIFIAPCVHSRKHLLGNFCAAVNCKQLDLDNFLNGDANADIS